MDQENTDELECENCRMKTECARTFEIGDLTCPEIEKLFFNKEKKL